VTQTTPVWGEIFILWVGLAVVDPLAKFKHCIASSVPEILKEFKICRQTDIVHRAYTVRRSRNQNITCHAHFVAWHGNKVSYSVKH